SLAPPAAAHRAALRLTVQHPLNSAKANFRPPGQITFPDADHAPARFSQRTIHQRIARNVACQLALPECAIVLRLRRVLGAAVPETAIHEKSETHLPEYKIHL